MIYNIGDKKINIVAENYYLADNATLVGDVTIENDCSIWFNAVLRGDEDSIIIGEGTNIQDGSVVHTDKGLKCVIGKRVTVGHRAVIHGCTIGDNSLIGINSVIMNRAKIGSNCIIGSNALVPEGKEIPDGSLVVGTPGKIIGQVNEKHLNLIKYSAEVYINKIKHYQDKLVRL